MQMLHVCFFLQSNFAHQIKNKYSLRCRFTGDDQMLICGRIKRQWSSNLVSLFLAAHITEIFKWLLLFSKNKLLLLNYFFLLKQRILLNIL